MADRIVSFESEKRSGSTSEDDERLCGEVAAALKRHHDIDARRIFIEVRDGEATLRGYVDSLEDKLEAERVVDDVPGLVAVNNELDVSRDAFDVSEGGEFGRLKEE
jgi:osmotically-inducible protein OsmY